MIFRDYLRMAHGLGGLGDDDTERIINGEDIESSLAWHDRERTLEQILEAKRMTRRRFMLTLAVPKPSYILNLVICAELRKNYDLEVPGFVNGIYQLPKSDGVLVPIDKEISGLRFVRMSEMVKPRKVLAGVTAAE